MISAKLFFLVVLLIACFAAVEAQWGYGYGCEFQSFSNQS